MAEDTDLFDYGDGDERLTDSELERIKELGDKKESALSDSEVTSKIKLSLKRRFDFPMWVMVFEFQNRDGKRADCLALNTSASRNFKLIGFEFKASRSDWLSEKKDPEKSDYFVELCDEWYVVAGRRNIVEESELPDGWGLLELKPSGRLYKLVDSDLNDMQNRSLDRRFYAKFMKKAMGESGEFTMSDIREAESRGYQKAIDEGVQRKSDRELERLEDKAESFDKIKNSGLSVWPPIDEEQVERLVRAENLLKSFEDDDFNSLRGSLKSLERSFETATERMEDEVARIEEMIDDIETDLPESDMELPNETGEENTDNSDS